MQSTMEGMTLVEENYEQAQLRHRYVDSDVSDVSYQYSVASDGGFPGTRQSSLNTEPLTLDSEQISVAQDEASNLLQSVDPDDAYDIFTKDLRMRYDEGLVQNLQAKHSAAKLQRSAEKTDQVMEAKANHAEFVCTIPGVPTMLRTDTAAAKKEEEARKKNL